MTERYEYYITAIEADKQIIYW